VLTYSWILSGVSATSNAFRATGVPTPSSSWVGAGLPDNRSHVISLPAEDVGCERLVAASPDGYVLEVASVYRVDLHDLVRLLLIVATVPASRAVTYIRGRDGWKGCVTYTIFEAARATANSLPLSGIESRLAIKGCAPTKTGPAG